MPNKEFLEDYPLYRKFTFKPSPPIPRPSINMDCSVCRSEQTFKMDDKYEWDRKGIGDVAGAIDFGSCHTFGQVDQVEFTEHAEYECAACGKGTISFLLMFSPKGGFVQKVGQFPPWSIRVDRNIEQILGQHVDIYKKGLTCESQSYGIGAFAYYRRIVEHIIDELLSKISDLMNEEEKKVYLKNLDRTKNSHSAQGKIELVKDLLPLSLRPDGHNPLELLYDNLSKGIHSHDDEQCLSYAEHIRVALLYLIDQVARAKEARVAFTESMKKLLDKKGKQSSGAG